MDRHVLGGTLSSYDLAGRLLPVVPAGIPFPVGPVDPAGPDGPYVADGPLARMGRCLRLSLTLLARMTRMLQVSLLARMGHCPRLTVNLLALVRECDDVTEESITVQGGWSDPEVVGTPAVVAMVGMDALPMRNDAPLDCVDGCTAWIADNGYRCETIEVAVLPMMVTPIVDPVVESSVTPALYPVPPIPVLSVNEQVPVLESVDDQVPVLVSSSLREVAGSPVLDNCRIWCRLLAQCLGRSPP